jgi:GNAT superfamily N-acetyltransferase
MSAQYRIEYLDRPGLRLDDEALSTLVAAMQAVAATCFSPVPHYQCLTGRREDLDDKVITLARDRRTGRIVGFCSAIVLPAERVGTFLHLGLTCVDPSARGGGLTHALTSKLVLRYFLRHRLFGRLWVTNVACVLSSLGNVALFFDEVHPSPFAQRPPTRSHRAIVEAIDHSHREAIYILPEATLDADAFVFRGSVRGTMFQKGRDDRRFWHRNAEVNQYYRQILDFEEGDEAVQVGWVDVPTLLRYLRTRGQRATQPLLPTAGQPQGAQ